MKNSVCARLLGIVLLQGAASAWAQAPSTYPDFSYNYLEAYYVNTELDDSGIELAGSVSLRRDVRVFASYLDQGYDDELDRETYQIGLTYHWGVNRNLDMLVQAALADTEVDRNGQTLINDDGFIVGAGLRAWLRPNLELNGSLSFDGSMGSGTDAVAEFGAQFYLNRDFSVGGRLRTDEDATALFLGGRYYFR